ncbi:MAG: hypothetical protein NT096_00580 [Proteobacteria bacterium]|nr:hypothetical protein [Pseudomonadota bacterium]
MPVTVVGIAGGTSVGKTTMMLMATAELIASSRDKQAGIVAEIDTAEQRILFDRERRRLESGVTVAPTSGSVPDAFILRVKYQKCRSLLYLYDAPGEEFSHIDTFSQHQWLQRADGLMLLVDPASLPGFIKQVGCIPDPEVQASKTPLTDVVNSCIVASEKMIGMQSGEGSSVPLAVVITKADLEAVKQRVGNFSVGINNGDLCRHALCEWGAGSAMQTVEKRFSNIKYFACSALGRTPSKKNTAPFSAYGVLDPLLWILEGTDSLKSTNQRGVVTKEA